MLQPCRGRKSNPALVLLLLIPALALSAAAAVENTPGRYTEIPASADGIGKAYLGRQIARVMSFHGAEWLERPERIEEERPELLLSALELKPGMTVADIGAGTGYYSWRMAQRVGPRGTVYAVDIQPEMIKLLEEQMSRRGAASVKAVLGTATDPGLPPGSIDLALMVDVYHELEYPYEMLEAIVRALKPGGRLAFVEFRSGDSAVPIKPLHTMSEAQVRKEAALHALDWVKTARDLPWQNAIVFRKVSGNQHGWAGDGRKNDNQMPGGSNTQRDRGNLILTVTAAGGEGDASDRHSPRNPAWLLAHPRANRRASQRILPTLRASGHEAPGPLRICGRLQANILLD